MSAEPIPDLGPFAPDVPVPAKVAWALHDTVIQRLFAVSYSLHSVASLGGSPEQRVRIERAIADLDRAIVEIRTAIFELGEGSGPSLRLGA
jgi:signal transduction histidine kinase